MIKVDIASLPLVNKPDSLLVLDATKLKDYITCPRKFFYAYVLGLQPSIKSHHLGFGAALHEVLAYIYENCLDHRGPEGIIPALEEWGAGVLPKALEPGLKVFDEELKEFDDQDLYPKTKKRLIESVVEYINNYKQDRENYIALDIETAGTVIISSSPERWVYFKMDAVLGDRRNGDIWAKEHKTGSNPSPQWQMQWELNFQIMIYAYALFMYYGERSKGVIVNSIHYKKKKSAPYFEFVRIPYQKNLNQLSDFIEELNVVIDGLEGQFELLSSKKISDPSMPCFPRHTESCSKYFGCPYHRLCTTTRNPLQFQEFMPSGFTTRFWDPREKTEKARKVLGPERKEND
jgi:hypothetical protein